MDVTLLSLCLMYQAESALDMKHFSNSCFHRTARDRLLVVESFGRAAGEAHVRPLDRGGTMSIESALEAFEKFAVQCPHRYVVPLPPRPCNGLNIEIGQPSPRCLLKLPDDWSPAMRERGGLIWILSGGGCLEFGHCTPRCALGQRWCPECGHRKEHHEILDSCCVDVEGWPCGCDHKWP